MEKDGLKQKCKLLIIGGSAGSLEVILQVLPKLGKLHVAMVLVMHRKNANDNILLDLLKSKTTSRVDEIEDKEPIETGCIYLAPPDYHLLFEKKGTCSLDYSEKVNYSRPSIDVAFESASLAYGPTLVCMLLSGANADGIEGLKKVKEMGGMIVVQNPETAMVPHMPQQAILKAPVDLILNIGEMAEFINSL